MFPFNQPDSTKEKPSKDCGYRCMYYVLTQFSRWETTDDGQDYDRWLHQFRFFQPVASGITFTDIATVLDFEGLDFRFTHLTDKGFYVIYSGIWLHHDTPPKKHGHYFIYQDGVIFCSTKAGPYSMPLDHVLQRLECKNIDHSYRILKVLGKKS